MRRQELAALSVVVLVGGLAGVVSASTASAAPSSAPSTAPSTIGSAGGGDSYYALQGNGGYDARHYSLNLRFDPNTRHLAGVARMSAVATMKLSRFDVDLRHEMTATRVLVNGRNAGHRQPSTFLHDLVITPAHIVPNARPFTVAVTYHATTHDVTDPDGSPDGCIPTNDGAFVANAPQ